MRSLLSPPPLATISFHLLSSFDSPSWINSISLPLPSASFFTSVPTSLQFILMLKTFFFFWFPAPSSHAAFLSFSTLFLPSLSVSSLLFSLPQSSSEWDYAKIEAPCCFAVGFKAISCSALAFSFPFLHTHTQSHVQSPAHAQPHTRFHTHMELLLF